MYEGNQALSRVAPFIDESDPAYSVPSELQPFCDRVLAGEYKPEPAEEELLKLKYVHMSVNWNNPIGGSRERGVTLRYTNAPTDDGMRVRHPHVADSSWRTFWCVHTIFCWARWWSQVARQQNHYPAKTTRRIHGGASVLLSPLT